MPKEEPTETTIKTKEKADHKPQLKKRGEKKNDEIKKLKLEIEELKEKILRKTAEFDNFKKRTEREFYDRILNANERLITELLPVADDLERFFDHSKVTEHSKSLVEGIELIHKKLLAILEKEGLKYIPSKGEDFNPSIHDALMQIESKDVDSGKIVEEHLKGYTLNDKVIRHSQVIVAK